MESLVTVLVLLLIGFFFGRAAERNHFARIEREEAELADIVVTNLKSAPVGRSDEGVLVTGNVVIAVDYFKKFIAGLKTLIGGRLTSYESLIERARREAIIRMKKEARALGANYIYNVRVEYSTVGQQPTSSGAELLAYGTALKIV